MADFIYPLSAVVLDFLCLLLCIRFLASKRGVIWVFPLLLTLAMLGGSAVCLLATASEISLSTLSLVANYVSVFLFLLSVIWMINIIALGSYTGKRRTSSEDLKTFNESEYVKRKTAPAIYFRNADKRATAASEVVSVKDSESDLPKRPVRDMYGMGPVATRDVQKTSFGK